MSKAEELMEIYKDLTWPQYYEIIEALIKFDKHDVENEMMRQASQYAYWQGLCSMAKRDLDYADLKFTQFVSSTRKKFREESSVKRTAKDLDDLVESTDLYTLYKKGIADANYKYTMIKGLVQALEQKKDMLQQLSANNRAETKLYN